jgi:hypothetical protein
MLERQGWQVNQKKLRRLYREENLQVRKRGGRKRALETRRPMLVRKRPNERWSLDFVSDAFTDGRRFRVLAIVDDFSRECLALVADTSLSGLRVTRELTAIMARRGRPKTIVSDNGTELTSMAVLRWCQETRIWPAAGFSDTRLSLHSLLLELDGAQIAQCRVPSPRVVEALDVVEHIRPGVIPRPVDLAGCPLGLQRREEALHRSIVPDVAGPAHRAGDAVVGHQALELLAGILLPWSE